MAGGSGGTTGISNITSIPASTSGHNSCTNPSLSQTTFDGTANSFSATLSAQQQFNIFPAIFSRQLNFSAAAAAVAASSSGSSSVTTTVQQQSKLMDELRPNLVGGLLGLQQGLLEDHALAHGNLQHSGHQETKFMSSLQDNRFIASHENRLLGLSQDLRSVASINNLDNSKNSSIGAHQSSRKCSSTPEDFSALYGVGLGDTSSHHHTPAHTPPSRLDHSITGKIKKTNNFF